MKPEKLTFLTLPTPILYLPSVSQDLGVDFYIKRDDMTDIGGGGNKLRKLEYIMKEVKDGGYTRVITTGGVQTNHGRLTAAVSSRLAIKCSIISIGEYPGELTGNMLFSRILGAEIIIKKDDGRNQDIQYEELIFTMKQKYEKEGERVYVIPMGGSSPVGALGYFDCGEDIKKDIEVNSIENPHVFCAVGSLGTFAGLYSSLQTGTDKVPITGIAIMKYSEKSENKLENLIENTLNLTGETESPETNETNAGNGKKVKFPYTVPDIRTEFLFGNYNEESPEVRNAVYYMARKEGIFLDPCYTGKLFAGILKMAENGELQGKSVIMVHTGGLPGLYTPHHRREMEKELSSGIVLAD